jgi:hypothetical protein
MGRDKHYKLLIDFLEIHRQVMGSSGKIYHWYTYDGRRNVHKSEFEFGEWDSSWDWLMPVYKKIRDYLESIERPSKNHCCKGDLLEVDIQCAVASIEIKKAFEAIVKFIKWHNTQN